MYRLSPAEKDRRIDIIQSVQSEGGTRKDAAEQIGISVASLGRFMGKHAWFLKGKWKPRRRKLCIYAEKCRFMTEGQKNDYA